MKNKNERAFEVLVTITAIPKNLIKIHGLENMTEFLLHNLSQRECFNFSKSAYFVDNPDFDLLKGVAGFEVTESYKPALDHWQEKEAFSNHMKQSIFNNKVRDTSLCSIQRNKKSAESVVKEISNGLHFENPGYVVWPIKYENQGLFVFEKSDTLDIEEHLENALHFFGFCPLF